MEYKGPAQRLYPYKVVNWAVAGLFGRGWEKKMISGRRYPNNERHDNDMPPPNKAPPPNSFLNRGVALIRGGAIIDLQQR